MGPISVGCTSVGLDARLGLSCCELAALSRTRVYAAVPVTVLGATAGPAEAVAAAGCGSVPKQLPPQHALPSRRPSCGSGRSSCRHSSAVQSFNWVRRSTRGRSPRETSRFTQPAATCFAARRGGRGCGSVPKQLPPLPRCRSGRSSCRCICRLDYGRNAAAFVSSLDSTYNIYLATIQALPGHRASPRWMGSTVPSSVCLCEDPIESCTRPGHWRLVPWLVLPEHD